MKRKNEPPSRLALFINDRCNLDCTYCYLPRTKRGRGELSLADGREIIKRWLDATAGGVNLCFFGREPLLSYPLMRQLGRYARGQAEKSGRALHLSLVTNCTLVTPNIARWLALNEVHVTASLDGLSAAGAQNRRFISGKDSSAKAAAGLRKLLAAGVAVHVRMTYTPETVAQLPAAIRELSEAGARHLGLAAALRMPGWTAERLAAVARAYREITRFWRQERTNGRPVWIAEVETVARQPRRTGAPLVCGAGANLWAADVSGNFYACYREVGQAGKATRQPKWRGPNGGESHGSPQPCRRCQVRGHCRPCRVLIEDCGRDLFCRHRRATITAVRSALAEDKEWFTMSKNKSRSLVTVARVGKKFFCLPDKVLQQYEIDGAAARRLLADRPVPEKPAAGYWYEIGESDCF